MLLTNQYRPLASGAPVIPTPAFIVPRTYAEQLGLSLTSAAFGIDSELTQPKVHQFNLSVEREVGFDMAVEARYVGTLGRDIWRGIDYNQVVVAGRVPRGLPAGAFERLPRARQRAAASTRPTTPAIPGSQPLTYIPQFGGGSLGNATVRTNIQTGQAGALADFYLQSAGAAVATQARQAFYGNPGIYAADIIINGASTDYHALQLETRRRFKNGLFWQANYTFSKSLSDSTGTAQARFEPFLDNARPGIERMRERVPRHARPQRQRDLGAALRRGPSLARSRRRAQRARRRLAGVDHPPLAERRAVLDHGAARHLQPRRPVGQQHGVTEASPATRSRP